MGVVAVMGVLGAAQIGEARGFSGELEGRRRTCMADVGTETGIGSYLGASFLSCHRAGMLYIHTIQTTLY